MYKTKYKLANSDVRNRKSQHFDKEKIFWIKAGKKINVYDEIQANTEGTSVRSVLEKYGCIDPIMRPPEDSFYGEFDKMMSLRDVYEQQDKATELWTQLAPGIREKFHNDPREFVKDGPAYFAQEIEKYKTAQAKATKEAAKTETKTAEGVDKK